MSEQKEQLQDGQHTREEDRSTTEGDAGTTKMEPLREEVDTSENLVDQVVSTAHELVNTEIEGDSATPDSELYRVQSCSSLLDAYLGLPTIPEDDNEEDAASPHVGGDSVISPVTPEISLIAPVYLRTTSLAHLQTLSATLEELKSIKAKFATAAPVVEEDSESNRSSFTTCNSRTSTLVEDVEPEDTTLKSGSVGADEEAVSRAIQNHQGDGIVGRHGHTLPTIAEDETPPSSPVPIHRIFFEDEKNEPTHPPPSAPLPPIVEDKSTESTALEEQNTGSVRSRLTQLVDHQPYQTAPPRVPLPTPPSSPGEMAALQLPSSQAAAEADLSLAESPISSMLTTPFPTPPRSNSKALKTLGIITDADYGIAINEKAMRLLGMSDDSALDKSPTRINSRTLRRSKTESFIISGSLEGPKRLSKPLPDAPWSPVASQATATPTSDNANMPSMPAESGVAADQEGTESSAIKTVTVNEGSLDAPQPPPKPSPKSPVSPIASETIPPRSNTKALKTLGILSEREAGSGIVVNQKAMKILGMDDDASNIKTASLSGGSLDRPQLHPKSSSQAPLSSITSETSPTPPRSNTKALKTLGILSDDEADNKLLVNQKAMKVLGMDDDTASAKSAARTSIILGGTLERTKRFSSTGTLNRISKSVDEAIKNSKAIRRFSLNSSAPATVTPKVLSAINPVEQASHQIIFSGFLHATKHHPQNFIRSWKRRYCVLTPGFLYLYHEPRVPDPIKDKDASDVLYVGVGTEVKITEEGHGRGSRSGFGFSIKSGAKVWYFWCDDMQWFEVVDAFSKELSPKKASLGRPKSAESEKSPITLKREDSGVSTSSARLLLTSKLSPDPMSPASPPPTAPLPPVPPKTSLEDQFNPWQHAIHSGMLPHPRAVMRRASTPNVSFRDQSISAPVPSLPSNYHRHSDEIRCHSLPRTSSNRATINSAINLLDSMLAEEQKRESLPTLTI
ncbi:hypothetical protein SpCBS45565_g04509 [Spizellomyces sp. 'palustris']|nr:hypothetical protein SpCBS45565_g04509 [Spizellomyces sp. 'palustris']